MATEWLMKGYHMQPGHAGCRADACSRQEEAASTGFHHTAQKGVHLKTCTLFLEFLRPWLTTSETTESKTVDMRGLLYYPYFLLKHQFSPQY